MGVFQKTKHCNMCHWFPAPVSNTAQYFQKYTLEQRGKFYFTEGKKVEYFAVVFKTHIIKLKGVVSRK